MIDAEAWRPPITTKDAEAEALTLPKKKLSMVSVATAQGKLRWAVIDGAFDAERQIKFVEALIRDTRKRKVFLIRSDWRTYAGPDFLRWISANEDRIRIFPESQTE